MKTLFTFTSSPTSVGAGQPVIFTFTPKDNYGKTVYLDIQHEKKLHLIVVSDDLSWFHHIHPEHQTDDSYTVVETFPYGGKFILFADYKPIGSDGRVEKMEINVQGENRQAATWSMPKLEAETGGYVVRFVNDNELKAGIGDLMKITIEKNGVQFKNTDMQKYLGASAHVVIISVDDKEFVHVHPDSSTDFPVYGHVQIAKPGIYRAWVQFQISGQVHTADFTLIAGHGAMHGASSHHSSGH